MRAFVYLVTAGAVALLAQTGPATAKGCIKGAIVGGVAGHYAGHHGLLGAAAGCAAGRDLAKRRKAAQTTGQATPNRKQINEQDTTGPDQRDAIAPP